MKSLIAKYINEVKNEHSPEAQLQTRRALVLMAVAIAQVVHLSCIAYFQLGGAAAPCINKTHAGMVLFLLFALVGFPFFVLGAPAAARIKRALVLLLFTSPAYIFVLLTDFRFPFAVV